MLLTRHTGGGWHGKSLPWIAGLPDAATIPTISPNTPTARQACEKNGFLGERVAPLSHPPAGKWHVS